ncbi:hypothetical protein PSHT_15053 [Puccinia striiformis]|uniref:Uncharacterized protein n=1 Tax=Puccinia striiformis TaxID=27350 RepID=A0A2S4UH16_9BASI|nr:hypothetical protein PSHT_15053 [Puccinia striiformis]
MNCQSYTNRTWMRALKHFDNQDLDHSLYVFEAGPFVMISRSPKIYFNMGMLHTGLGEHPSAVDCFRAAVSDEAASAVEFFQLGALLFSLEDYELAHQNFSVALLLMNGRSHIDYREAGLNFCLYSCEVLFNCAMCLLHMGKFDEGTETLAHAREKQHYPSQIPCSLEVFSIPDAGYGSSTRADYWTVFQVPNKILYRPVTQASDTTSHSPGSSKVGSILSSPSTSPTEYLPSITDNSSSNETISTSRRESPLKLFKMVKQRWPIFFK